MLARLAADAVLVAHLGFVLFVVFGGVLAARWRWAPLVHLPAAAWGAFVEVTGRICPLTHLENHLRLMAGQSGYRDSFIEHYLLPVIYPAGLTRDVQGIFALLVIVANVLVYGWLRVRRRRAPKV